MKKFLSVLIAATVLAAPLAQAQSRHEYRHDDRRRVTTERTIEKKTIIKKHRWERGQRVSAAQRRHFIDQRDYRRYKLSAPKRDQRWIRVDNQFLLINAATGLIIGLSSMR